MKLLRITYKLLRTAYFKIDYFFCWNITWMKFLVNGVQFRWNYISHGVPIVNVSLKGKLLIGSNFNFHSGKYYNIIGRQQPCYLIVGPDAGLYIGNNVGISCSALICYHSIRIGDNVKIGGNVVVYDTDFHSIDASKRNRIPEDKSDLKMKPVIIEDGVFIGAHATILKGVTIGSNAVIGAGSVVTRSVPPNQVWAGNPARFVKDLN